MYCIETGTRFRRREGIVTIIYKLRLCIMGRILRDAHIWCTAVSRTQYWQKQFSWINNREIHATTLLIGILDPLISACKDTTIMCYDPDPDCSKPLLEPQCWISISEVLRNSTQWDFTASVQAIVLYDTIENYIFEITASYPTNQWVNTLRPRRNGRHFADDIFCCIFMKENVWIPIKISLKFVPKGPINNIPTLVQIMAWRRLGDKPLSESMMISLPTHICFSRPQWVKMDIVITRTNVLKSYGIVFVWTTSARIVAPYPAIVKANSLW